MHNPTPTHACSQQGACVVTITVPPHPRRGGEGRGEGERLSNPKCALRQVSALVALIVLSSAVSQGATSESTTNAADAISRIRDEGLNHSQVMQTLSHLTEAIGPRLTGSPNLKRANEWTRDTLASWGLTDAHLEAWGPFGRGWSLKRFSAQIVEPQTIPLIGFPNAWSPGFDQPFVARRHPLRCQDQRRSGEIQRQALGCHCPGQSPAGTPSSLRADWRRVWRRLISCGWPMPGRPRDQVPHDLRTRWYGRGRPRSLGRRTRVRRGSGARIRSR